MVYDASAEGASENFRVFGTETAYDVIVFKFQGVGQLPQVAPRSERLCTLVFHCTVVPGFYYMYLQICNKNFGKVTSPVFFLTPLIDAMTKNLLYV